MAWEMDGIWLTYPSIDFRSQTDFKGTLLLRYLAENSGCQVSRSAFVSPHQCKHNREGSPTLQLQEALEVSPGAILFPLPKAATGDVP